MKKISAVLICIILVFQFAVSGTVFAEDILGNVEYKPADIVVIVDTSGSMNFSDCTPFDDGVREQAVVAAVKQKTQSLTSDFKGII